MADLNIDIVGTPSIIAAGNKSLSIGCAGTGLLNLVCIGGGLAYKISNPAEGSAATTVASSGTIDTTIGWQRITNAGAITGVILEAGTTHGQLCIVSVDKDAAGTVTMAAAGTSRVGTGTACVIAVGAARMFIWDATDAIWCELGET